MRACPLGPGAQSLHTQEQSFVKSGGSAQSLSFRGNVVRGRQADLGSQLPPPKT
jgi:hypothetical protein